MLVLILLVIGTFLWCRIRQRRLQRPLAQNEEESIPLTRSMGTPGDDGDEDFKRQRKGKGRAIETSGPPIFDVGDDDDEEGHKNNDQPR